MRKILYLIFTTISLFAWTGSVKAEPVQSVSLNPLGLVWGISDVEYERRLTDDSTWYARGLYWATETGDWSWYATGVAGGYRKYFKGRAFEGPYLGANGGFMNLSAEYEPIPGLKGDSSALFVSLNGELGYRWLFTNNITISLAGTAGFATGSLSVEVKDASTGLTYSEDVPARGFGLGGEFRIGYTW